MLLSGLKTSHIMTRTVPLCVTLTIPPFAVSTTESKGVSVPLKSSLQGDICAVAPESISQSVADVTSSSPLVGGGGFGPKAGLLFRQSCHSALDTRCFVALARSGFLVTIENSV
jgi:hypothetical protein